MMASGELDMNPFRRIDELPAATPLIVSAEELEVYVKAFEKTGFRGGINWYRNIDRNGREHPEVGTKKLTLPCLMITADWDIALRPQMAAGMPALCSDLVMHNVAKAGHWVQQEFPNEVNEKIVGWLKHRFGN
jgi:pimeloyl-ACP methyl ester carboxylesterase